MNDYTNAAKGNIFVLTEQGYNATPDHVKPERAVGKPVFSFYKDRVPTSWITKGYVQEIKKERVTA